jgi:DNA-binding transcriptional regulator GbsR (MarR family)
LKKKDAKIKEAQGRMSIAEGDRNKARVLGILMKKPLAFSELKEAAKLSSPVLSKHLKVLSEEGMIQKALSRDDKVVYQVISEKQAVKFIETLFGSIFLYIFGRKLSAETMDSIRRDLEKMISKEDSEAFVKEFEQKKDVVKAVEAVEPISLLEEDRDINEDKD